MGLVGKILAILNVVAALIFILLLALDYGVHQSWSLAVHQQEIVLNGLPVDENQKDAEGQTVVDTVGKGLSERLSATVKGGPIATQKEEVMARKANLRSTIEGAGDDAAKRKALEKALLPLAPTWGKREELRRQIQNEKEKIEALLDGPFEAEFKQAVSGRDDDGKPLELDQWRQAIAHVLFNTSDDPDDRKRTVVVVGLTSYAREVNGQAAVLQNMVPQVQAAMANDRAAFELAYKRVLHEIEILFGQVSEVQVSLEKQEKIKGEMTARVDERQKTVDGLQKDIEAAKKAVAAAVARQKELETALFKAERKVAETKNKNLDLERKISDEELKDKGGVQP